eukprot:939798-Pelagomonas_calceolata.AAC.5
MVWVERAKHANAHKALPVFSMYHATVPCSQDNPGHSEWLTDIMLMGLAPVLVFGVALSFARLRLSTYNILKTIRWAH